MVKNCIFGFLMNSKFYFYFLLFIFSLSEAQEIPEKGIPFVRTYLPEEYGNHGKIWDISAAKNGLVYMASENGLLEFDGKKWNKYRDYKGFTRSLFIANDSTIYVGADMDFGVWKRNKYRKFDYQSFYPFKTKIGGVNEEFWGTYWFKNQVVFVSHQNLYRVLHHKITKIAAPIRFFDSFQVGKRLFLADEKNGLYEYDGQNLHLLFSYPNEVPLEISGIYEDEGHLHIVSRNRGIFSLINGQLLPLQSEISKEIIKNKVFSFTSFNHRYLAFGTILNGIYITDYQGNIVQHLNKNKGLPNNTILSLFYQNNGKIWMGLDYGIAFSDIKNNITYFKNSNSDFGTGYTATLKNDIFYLGTNQGLYAANWNELNSSKDQNPFALISGAEGQVWTLQKIGDKVICGHDRGLFEVNGRTISKIHSEPGVMSLLEYDQNTLFTGNYNGISIFKKENNSWAFLRKMEVILGAINQIVAEKKNILWVNIPNYGVIRFEIDQNYKPIKKTIFSTKKFKGYFPYIFKNQNGVHIITSTHQYLYLPENNDFKTENMIPLVNVKNKFTGFYFPIPLNSEYSFYSVNNGFALEKIDKSSMHSLSSELIFRKVQAFNNEESIELSTPAKIPYQFNNLRFSFILPNESEVQYQYYLEGFSEEWSSFSSKNEIEFLGLKEGNYVLNIVAKKGDKITSNKKFVIRIEAPWYRSFWSYLVYSILIFALIHLLRLIHEKRLKKQKRHLLEKERKSLKKQAEKHEQELLLEKQKQLELEQNILKEEIKNKTKELATKAKNDDDKIRLLQTINDKILEAESNPNISKLKLGEIRRMLKSYLEREDHTFEIQMDELHQEFFKVMKKKFPNLSIYDLRMCAYLKIGLNSKEIADIFQVLPSSINVSRSRLRKKLNLSPDEDLYEFLNSLE